MKNPSLAFHAISYKTKKTKIDKQWRKIMGQTRECNKVLRTQQPMHKNFDSGKAVAVTVALRVVATQHYKVHRR